MAPNALKHYEMQQNMSLGSIGVDRVHSLRIIRYDFMAWTFAVIAPVQPILHRVSCSNGMVPNAPKHYKTQQNLSFWSHGVDRLRSLRQIPTQLRGMNFCINCTSWDTTILHRVYYRNKTFSKAPKHYEMHQNKMLRSNGVDRVRSLRKITMRLRGMNFYINCTSSARFAPSLLP